MAKGLPVACLAEKFLPTEEMCMTFIGKMSPIGKFRDISVKLAQHGFSVNAVEHVGHVNLWDAKSGIFIESSLQLTCEQFCGTLNTNTNLKR